MYGDICFSVLRSYIKYRAYLSLNLRHILSHFDNALSLSFHNVLCLFHHSGADRSRKLSLLHTCRH